jgi:hypothetical protein
VVLVLLRLEDSEPQEIEWLLRMPSIKGAIHSDEENTFENFLAVLAVLPVPVETREEPLHE